MIRRWSITLLAKEVSKRKEAGLLSPASVSSFNLLSLGGPYEI
jgi:hypothetical protein